MDNGDDATGRGATELVDRGATGLGDDVDPRGRGGRRVPRFRTWLGLITVGGLVVRFGFTIVARRHQPIGKVTDNRWYYAAGKMLARGWGFGNPFVWGGQHRYLPSAGHPPLYPVFLGAASWIGLSTPLEQRLATCVLGVLAVLVIGLAARELAGDRAGLVAAFLAAIYPNLWINDGALLSETPFILLIALFLWAAIRCWRSPTFGRVAWMSLWIGFASLTRSESILLYPLAVLPMLLRARSLPMRARVQRVAAAAGVAVLVVGPWVLYNNLGRFHHPVAIVSGSGVAMSYGNCDKTYSGQFLGYWYWTCGETTFPKHGDETDLDAIARKKAVHYIRAHLGEQPKVVAARVGRLFGVYQARQSIVLDNYFERRGLWPSRLGLWMYYPVTVLGLIGAVILWRRKQTVIPYVAITITVIVAAALTFGVTRYRVGFDAAAVVLAAVAIDATFRRLDRPRAAVAAPVTPPLVPASAAST